MLSLNFNTVKTINHFDFSALTNFNYSDYFKEQNKQELEEKITFISYNFKKNIRR